MNLIILLGQYTSKEVKKVISVKSLNFLIHGTHLTVFCGANADWTSVVRGKLSDTFRDLPRPRFYRQNHFFFVFSEILGKHLTLLKPLFEQQHFHQIGATLSTVLEKQQFVQITILKAQFPQKLNFLPQLQFQLVFLEGFT